MLILVNKLVGGGGGGGRRSSVFFFFPIGVCWHPAQSIQGK